MATQIEEKTFRLDENRTVRVNEYKGQVYFHFNDVRKSKSCSLSLDAFKKLLAKGNKMIDFAHKIKQPPSEYKNKKRIKKEIVSEESEFEFSD